MVGRKDSFSQLQWNLQAFHPDGNSILTGNNRGALHSYTLPTPSSCQEPSKAAKRKRDPPPMLALQKQVALCPAHESFQISSHNHHVIYPLVSGEPNWQDCRRRLLKRASARDHPFEALLKSPAGCRSGGGQKPFRSCALLAIPGRLPPGFPVHRRPPCCHQRP